MLPSPASLLCGQKPPSASLLCPQGGCPRPSGPVLGQQAGTDGRDGWAPCPELRKTAQGLRPGLPVQPEIPAFSGSRASEGGLFQAVGAVFPAWQYRWALWRLPWSLTGFPERCRAPGGAGCPVAASDAASDKVEAPVPPTRPCSVCYRTSLYSCVCLSALGE